MKRKHSASCIQQSFVPVRADEGRIGIIDLEQVRIAKPKFGALHVVSSIKPGVFFNLLLDNFQDDRITLPEEDGYCRRVS